MAKRNIDMLNGPIFKSVILFALPLILTNILKLLFNAADLIIVGRSDIGSLAIAAVGATTSLINLLINLFMGISVGAGVCVAHAIGAGNRDFVQRAVHTAMPLSVIGGAILTVVGFFGCEAFLQMMNTPSDVLNLSAIYMKIFFLGIIPMLIFDFGAAILRAAGDTRSPLLYLALAGVLNVVLNLIFVTAFNMNVDGVAAATSVSQLLSAVLVVIKLARRDDACRLCISKIRIHKAPLLSILKIGLPAGIQSSLFSVSNVIIQSSINSFGAVAVTANSAASNIEHFVYTAIPSFSQTVLNFTGQNAGAGNYRRIKRVFLVCCVCVAAVTTFFGGMAYIFSKPLLKIYITDSVSALTLGKTRLFYISALYALCGLMDSTTSAIRGLGHSLVPMLITVIGVCAFRVFWVSVIFAMPQFQNLQSIYLSYPVSWVITLLAQLPIFVYLMRKKQKAQNGIL